MPSLWKKHKKGKKISRLVVDLQTCPKQHETLVVENGVSTSLDDIGKNKDKLKKLSKKKQRSSKKYNTPITMEEYDHSSLPVLQKLNGKYVPQSRFEASNFSIDNQNKYELILHDNNECRTSENKASYNVMHVIWLNIMMGIFVTGITLYYNMFKFGIIFGVMFLIIFEYAGNLIFPLVKNRDAVVLKSISKGFFVVVVTLCTNRVLVGISIGFCALFLLGIVKKIIFPFLKHCQDGKDKHDQPEFKQRNGDIEVVMNTGLIHTKSKKEAQENGDELQVKDDITIVDEGNGGGSNKVVVKQVNMDNKPVNTSSSSEDEKIWNEIINEIDSLEQNYSVWPRQSPQVVRNPAESADEDCGQLRKIESKGKTKTIDESSNDVVIERGKLKKRRKFWKKLVPKHMRKNKKNKYAKEGHETSVDFVKENETEFEETEMEEVEDSSSISSDENEDGEEQYASANNSYNERSRANNGGTKKDIAKENKKDIVKVLIVMIIPLVGLLGGRVFAFVLTLIGCVLFNMLRD